MATLGVSVVKLKTLRPLLGRPSTASTPSRVAEADSEISRVGSACTVSSWSCTTCGASEKLSVTVSPKPTATAPRRDSRNPSARPLMS
jgi:hypothetical protein